MIVFAREGFSVIKDEILPLWQDAFRELEEDQDTVPLDPDYDKYAFLESAGHLLIFTARRDGVLVGYLFVAVDTHLHHRSTLFGSVDMYYLAPDCRGGRTAFRMFRAMDAELKARGVRKVVNHTIVTNDQIRLFQALGYHDRERVLTKLL